MEKKNLKLPMSFEKLDNSVLNDDTLVYARVKVMHSDLNLNNSTFFEESIKNAEGSLKNKPILAYIKKTDGEDKKDFAGHEIEVTLADGEVKVTYLERPIGVIPESNNYEMVEEDGKLWVYSDAYLWVDYANEAMDIFEENNVKSVSMEIVIDDYELKEDGTFDITAYRYNGVTVLGDDVNPAMTGAQIEVNFSENSTLDDEIINRISSLNERLAIAFAAQEPVEDEPIAEPVVPEFQAEPVEEPETTVTFELTYQERRELLSKAVSNSETGWAWVRDFTDTEVMYEVESNADDEWTYVNYKVSYTMSEENEVVLSEDKEEIFLVWLTQAEKDSIEAEKNAFEAKIAELNECIETITTEKDALVNQVDTYKANERAEKEENLFSEFDELLKNSDEYDELKVAKCDYSIGELEDKLYAIYGRINKPTTKVKPKQKMASNFSLVDEKVVKLENDDPYGGIFKKNEEE
jgi:hypothetical protein